MPVGDRRSGGPPSSSRHSFAGSVQSRTAGSNCVANEVGTSVFTTLAPGNYQVHALYTGGNAGRAIYDVVTNLNVQPSPFPPPEPDPCGGLPAYFCYG